MNFEFSLRQLVVVGLAILVILLCAIFPSLLPLSFFKTVYRSVISELEVLHVIRTDSLPMQVISHTAEEPNEEQIKKEYPRTRYEMYSPQDGLLNPPSEDVQKSLDQLAQQYVDGIGTSLDNAMHCKRWLDARLSGQALVASDEAELERTMRKASPIIRKALSAARAGSCSAGDMVSALPRQAADGISPIVQAANIFSLEALESKRQGKLIDAYFEISDAAKAFLPASTARLEDQEAALEGFDTVMHTWRAMIESDNNIQRLETALTQMNDVGGELRQRLSQVRDPVARDLMARIRQLPLEKKERDSVERTTPDYLFNFYSQMGHKYITDPTKVPALEQELEKVKGRVVQAMEARGKTPSPHAQTLLEKASLAEMDLTRIGLAEQIKHLADTEDKTVKLDKLTPRYIPYTPTDPFGDKEYMLRKSDEVSSGTLVGKRENMFSLYYSVGPDGKDQKGALLYDPTNGAASSGDIYIP